MEFTLPRSALPENKMARRQILDDYFPSGLIPFEQSYGSEWRITSFSPSDPAYFVDPQIERELTNWETTVETLGSYRRRYKNAMISLEDTWSVYYWSLVNAWLRSKELGLKNITLFHIDDHQDLSSPHLIYTSDKLVSIFSGNQVDFLDPSSIENSVLNKSIGIASFIAPLLSAMESVQILHLRYAHQGVPEHYKISCVREEDQLLAKGSERLSLEKNKVLGVHPYSLSADPGYLIDQVNTHLILLHIDCDAFSNRYNLDTNCVRFATSIDLKLEQIKIRVEELFLQMDRLSCPIYMNIALSPGFFPAEYWEETCRFILRTAEKHNIVRDDGLSEYIKIQYAKELTYEI